MPPDHDVGFVISMSAIPFVMNVIFLIGGWLFYKFTSPNPRFNAIQILPDLLEKDHKIVFFGKIDLINKKVKSHFILIATINTILLLLIIGYSFALAPLIQENISHKQKFEIFLDLILVLMKIFPFIFILYGFKLQLSPIIPRAWIALFENENIDTSFLKNSNNRFLNLFWKERYFSDLLFIHARTFIRDNYPEKQHYLYILSKDMKNYTSFIKKDKKQTYGGFSGFLLYFKNRLIHVLFFSELKMIKAKPQTTFHSYSIFGTILFALGFFSIPYTSVYLGSLLLILFSFIAFILGGLILMYGDFKLIYLNHKSFHTILSNYNIENFNNILDRMIVLLDKEFPYTKLKPNN